MKDCKEFRIYNLISVYSLDLKVLILKKICSLGLLLQIFFVKLGFLKSTPYIAIVRGVFKNLSA